MSKSPSYTTLLTPTGLSIFEKTSIYSIIWTYTLIGRSKRALERTEKKTYVASHCNTKGQLISKGLFGVFNSPKKRTKNVCLSRLGQKFEFSNSFFGRIKDTKKTFRN